MVRTKGCDVAERRLTAEKTSAAEMRNAATGETEIYLSIENSVEERLHNFKRVMRAKRIRSEADPGTRRPKS
jgi:hypothetical protein|tara:strand:+ start:1581 stop:1796 length:216 start_codon:yes stop_codon:yes gene_type:complete